MKSKTKKSKMYKTMQEFEKNYYPQEKRSKINPNNPDNFGNRLAQETLDKVKSILCAK